ncbi:hypothetical protein SAMN05443661_10439 [Natronobacterium gregoryi]|uniref:Uncharacterized protein n=2 Tax=Natronobacterium gregoryi TaxID=44930 RepID=L0AHS5_NATGS|nr:hypothetical protein Natgr_2287 [Natronobacterium gregoryi SP2]SFI71374.1 hypothetical protein SAMN05443661_10439 [Natronobacterium gregoryi]
MAGLLEQEEKHEAERRRSRSVLRNASPIVDTSAATWHTLTQTPSAELLSVGPTTNTKPLALEEQRSQALSCGGPGLRRLSVHQFRSNCDPNHCTKTVPAVRLKRNDAARIDASDVSLRGKRRWLGERSHHKGLSGGNFRHRHLLSIGPSYGKTSRQCVLSSPTQPPTETDCCPAVPARPQADSRPHRN